MTDNTLYALVGVFALVFIVVVVVVINQFFQGLDEGIADVKKQVKKTWAMYEALPPDDRKEFDEAIKKNLPFQRVLTFPGCVVTYEPAALHGLISRLFDPSKIDRKLGEILSANPNADLTRYEEALGIKIIDVQRQGQISAGDIFIGE
jgi:hypothetical protein